MKYTIESTENGCIETIELQNGKEFKKEHVRTTFGSQCKDEDFATQMEYDGIGDSVLLDEVYDTFDGFIASSFMKIAEYEE